MEVYLQLKFSNGDIFEVPADIVAKQRAAYYAELDSGAKEGAEYERIYAEELEYTLGSRGELHDWLDNNMDWSDFEAVAVKIVNGAPFDYHDGFRDIEVSRVERADTAHGTDGSTGADVRRVQLAQSPAGDDVHPRDTLAIIRLRDALKLYGDKPFVQVFPNDVRDLLQAFDNLVADDIANAYSIENMAITIDASDAEAERLEAQLVEAKARAEKAEAALEPFGRMATAISKARRYEADAEVRPDRIEWSFNDDVKITLGDLERVIMCLFERDLSALRADSEHDSAERSL